MSDKNTRFLNEYLMFIEFECGLSKHSVEAYKRDIKNYLLFVDKNIEDVISNDIENFIQYSKTKRNANPKSIARYISSIKQFHKFLVRENRLRGDESASIKTPMLEKHLPYALTYEEITLLLNTAKKGDRIKAALNNALIDFMYSTGVRVSETTKIDIGDINFEEGSVKVFGKGKKERIVPIGSYAIDAINHYMTIARPVFIQKGTGTMALFVNQHGRRISRQSIWLILQNVAKKAGLTQKIHPHTLRHSFATHMLSGGANIRVIQELLGHSNISTTQIYTKIAPLTLIEEYLLTHPRAK